MMYSIQSPSKAFTNMNDSPSSNAECTGGVIMLIVCAGGDYVELQCRREIT